MDGRTERELCRAKLNLMLDVVGKRSDGFHDIETVFHAIAYGDELTVRTIDDVDEPRTVRLRIDDQRRSGPTLPNDGSNLATRAAVTMLCEAGVDTSLEIILTKRIPVGAGLGGGSSDAAGVLRAVNRLLDLGYAPDDLERVGAALGSDVPFLVRGGTAIGRGRGERLEPLDVKHSFHFAVLLPALSVSTAGVFGSIVQVQPRVGVQRVRDALLAGDFSALAAATHNALREPAFRVEPRLEAVYRAARNRLGPGVEMTGSGFAFFVPLSGETLPPSFGLPHDTEPLFVRSASPSL